MRLDLFASANSDGKNSISKLTNSGQSRTASELLLAELFLLEASFLYHYYLGTKPTTTISKKKEGSHF